MKYTNCLHCMSGFIKHICISFTDVYTLRSQVYQCYQWDWMLYRFISDVIETECCTDLSVSDTVCWAGSSGWRFIFKQGLFLTVNSDVVESFYFMRAILAVSSRLQPGQYEGLWGNMNGNNNDDFTPHGKTHSFTSPSVDQVYLWADTCRLSLCVVIAGLLNTFTRDWCSDELVCERALQMSIRVICRRYTNQVPIFNLNLLDLK